MSLVQILYFVFAAVLMSGIASLILVPVLNSGEYGQIYTRLVLSFAVKMVLGAATMMIAWKLLDWPARISAFGSIGTYLMALMVTTLLAFKVTKRGGK